MTDKDILLLYREMELELIDSMKRNLGLHLAEETETGLDYPQWQAIKLRELRKYQQENRDIIGGKTLRLSEEVAKQLRDELRQGHESEIAKFLLFRNAKKYKSAVAMNESFFKLNTRKVDALIEEVNGSLLKANHAALRMANDVYREVIFKSGMFVANGVMTEQQAYDRAMKDFLNRGLNCIEYKDGRRVNIADYTSMAVRTANQRAYMMGEGEFRKEIGNPLIIISRHDTSCELCAPFQNKVLIDDVYSGGTQDDGDYMLLSEAMDKGLYHPGCRHGLGTYYPEIDEIDREYDGYVERDVTDYGEYSKAHIENMIQRYKRLSLGSIDSDNVARYEAKLREWEDKLTSFNVANSENGGIIDIEIDELVPCLRDMSTGKLVETEASGITRYSLKSYNQKNGWIVDWSDRPKDEHIFGVFVKGDNYPQGLISLKYEKGGTYISLAVNAPQNNKLIVGNAVKYKGVGGHLFAIAVEESIKNGGSGTIYGYAANKTVLKHYIEQFGAMHLPIRHQYQFLIEGKDSEKLLKTYNYERRD